MSKTRRFTETLIDYIQGVVDAKELTYKLNLGGGSGVGGGSGLPWNGIIGQLIQTYIAYDITETISPIIPSGASLLDNLNHMRYHMLPATWFETSPKSIRQLKVHVNSGIWYFGERTFLEFAGADSPTIVRPTVNPRIDVVYVTSSGTIGMYQGAEAVVPIITMPTISGILPVSTLYVRPSSIGIGWEVEDLVYSGYIHRDIRPFIFTAAVSDGVSSGIASVAIQEDDIPVGNATTINFEGNVQTLDEGNSKVTVTIGSGLWEPVTDGYNPAPELIFASGGDVIMVESF